MAADMDGAGEFTHATYVLFFLTMEETLLFLRRVARWWYVCEKKMMGALHTWYFIECQKAVNVVAIMKWVQDVGC